MLVDLLGVAVLADHAAQDAQAAHEDDLDGQTGIAGTTALAETGVSALGLGLEAALHAAARVDHVGLAQDEPVLDQLAHVLAGVGGRDLAHLIGVEPLASDAKATQNEA